MKNCICCRQPIPAERLEAMPETEICVGCSAAVGGEFVMVVTMERTNKSGSMKRNYGGLNVQRVRKYIPPLP